MSRLRHVVMFGFAESTTPDQVDERDRGQTVVARLGRRGTAVLVVPFWHR